MPVFTVDTPQRRYSAIVERGAVGRVLEFLPARTGAVFVVTTTDVWRLHGHRLAEALGERPFQVLTFRGGEENKRLAELERLAEEMVAGGGDRTSIVIGFGGGIVTDLGGFLAAVFLRGIPVIQIPTTLLAQVDAGVGGKTGVNLETGKNLIGSFHQPLAVLTDPDLVGTLPIREFRAGLFEIIKCGVIRDAALFYYLHKHKEAVLQGAADALEHVIAASVSLKAAVVTADEREGDLRRILNFGHTFGHALEAETRYTYLLHGEAVSFGMRAAAHLAAATGRLSQADASAIYELLDVYGPIPPLAHINPENIQRRLVSDKKTVHGKVHFVLPRKIGTVEVTSDVPEDAVLESIRFALQ